MTYRLLTLQGHLLAVGTHLGYVQVWDAAASKKVSTLSGHSGRASELTFDCGTKILAYKITKI